MPANRPITMILLLSGLLTAMTASATQNNCYLASPSVHELETLRAAILKAPANCDNQAILSARQRNAEYQQGLFECLNNGAKVNNDTRQRLFEFQYLLRQLEERCGQQ